MRGPSIRYRIERFRWRTTERIRRRLLAWLLPRDRTGQMISCAVHYGPGEVYTPWVAKTLFDEGRPFAFLLPPPDLRKGFEGKP